MAEGRSLGSGRTITVTADWASTVGSTFSASFNSTDPNDPGALNSEGTPDYGARFKNEALFVGQQALVAGAIAFIDRNAAAQYFSAALGQEVGSRLGAGFKVGFANGQRERAQEAERARNQSAAATVGTRQQASTSPVTPVQDVPQPSTADLLVDIDQLDAQLRTSLDEQLQRSMGKLADELASVPITVSHKLEAGETLWGLAKNDLGPGATDAAIQERVYQYVEANRINDPRRLRAGAEIIVPSDSQVVSQTALAVYARSDAELQNYRAQQAAAAAAAQAAQVQVQSDATRQGGMLMTAPSEQSVLSPFSLSTAMLVSPNGVTPTLPGGVSLDSLEKLVPRDGVLGVAAGEIAGAHRFVKGTVEGLWNLAKMTYQSYDYMITGNENSRAGYDQAAALGTSVANLFSDSYDTYAYLITGNDKYRAGYEANGARGDAIANAAVGMYERFKQGDAYERSAIVTEGGLTVLSMFVGAGEVKAAGTAGTVARDLSLAEKAAGATSTVARDVGIAEDAAAFARTTEATDALANSASKYDNALLSTDFRQTQAASSELFDAVRARREVTVAAPGSDDLRFLDMMGADASAGGPGNMSILVRSERPQRLTLMEEFLHGTQSKIFGEASLDAAGAQTAFREWHVRDFMSRHSKMFGWDAHELQSLQKELQYWAVKAGKSGG